VTEGLRKLHNEELNDLCVSPNLIRMVRDLTLAGHVASIEQSPQSLNLAGNGRLEDVAEMRE
jgi:hypothetical protein